MSLNIECPSPERSLKRALQDIHVDLEHTNKHLRRLSPSRPLNAPRSKSCSSKVLSRPRSVGSLKFPLEVSRSTPKNFRPPPTTSPQVDDWLSNISYPRGGPENHLSRPSSAPPKFSGREELASIDTHTYQAKPLANILTMTPQSSRGVSHTSPQSSKGVSSSPMYRSILLNNSIGIDHTGQRIPAELRDFLEMEIFRKPSSPPLSQAMVSEVMVMAEELADSLDANVSNLVNTPMLPVRRRGIAHGANSLWSKVALPDNPIYPHSLSAPKPDHYYGYPTNLRSGWSVEENTVLDHPVVQPYAQPGGNIKFPFLAVEAKSEATGGTLWHAENQAAGSGSHCVNAMRWFLRQAYPSRTHPATDAVAFTAVLTHRQVIFHVHYYSEEDGFFHMSFIGAFSCFDSAEIQKCHNIVHNILDYGLTTRLTMIREALAQLFPFPEDWDKSRFVSAVGLTPTG